MFESLPSGLRPQRINGKRLGSTTLIFSLLLFSFSVKSKTRAAESVSQQPAAGAQTTQEVTALESGKPIERKLTGGERHNYQITLADGQYAFVVVEQRGIDVAVRVLGEKGNAISQFDSEIRNHGQEPVDLLAEGAGTYRVVIEAKGTKDSAGKYEVRLSEIRTATDRDRSLQEARRLLAESSSLFRAGKYNQAVSPGEQAIEIRERELGPEHTEVGTALNVLAVVYRNKGDFDKAEHIHQRALKIIEKSLGPEHPNVASALNSLATVYFEKSDYDKAELLYKRALSIWEKSVGPEHPNVASTLNNFANVYLHTGELDKAELLYKRSLEIREKLLGPEHPQISTSLYNLASVSLNKGDFDRSEQLFQRALKIIEKSLGPEHPNVAATLNGLANVYLKKNDYEKAESFYKRALNLGEKLLGPEHPDNAHSLNNLALVHRNRGELDKAEPMYKRALEIREKSLGPEHPQVAVSLNNLASLYLNKGDIEKAESLYKRSLEIREKSLGPEHHEVAYSLNNLAVLYRGRGDFDKAEQLHLRAVDISEKSLGPKHPEVGTLFNELATLFAAKGDVAKAVTAQLRANAIKEHNTALNLVTGSERQKLAYLASLSDITDRTLSLHIRAAANNSEACELAATTVLQRKGRVLDALADNRSTLRQHLGEQDQKLLDQLNANIARLARLVLNGPQQVTPAEHQKQIKGLEEQREEMEVEISRRSAGYYRPSQTIALAQVRAAIPKNAALIEFAIYRSFDPKAASGKSPFTEPRYVAYVIRNQGEVRWTELGAAKEIDNAVETLRKALRDTRRKDVREIARRVDEKIMQPVRALLGDSSQLLISPDGALNLIPFEALVDEQNRYLIERFSCSYLTSGRDLIRLQIARASKSAPLVVANPMFGDPDFTATAKADASKSQPIAMKGKRQSVTTGSDLSNVYFASLGVTAQEGQAIKSLFTDASLLTGAEASESSLKRAAAPRLLHIATHGFFLTDEMPSSTDTSAQGTRAISASVNIENPLLRSGLALAGANLHKGDDDDGILTALEASGLNLWGTKLVTLSACDTGLGEVKNGEGVYGLRRALILAGTETLVMSLWPVSDYVTREMMTAYYKGLREGGGRGEALRQVQISMMKSKGREHPFYWAGFIQSGEWASLDGKR